MKVKNILISQPKPVELEKSPYFEIIQKHGVKFEFKKFFAVTGIPAKEFRQDRVNLLDYTGVIFTSRNAVDHYFRIAKEMRIEIPDGMKYYCISDQTAYYLQKYIQFRKRKIFFGNQSIDELVDLVRKHKDEKFLLPCNDSSNERIKTQLDSHGIRYKLAVIYKNEFVDLSDIDPNSFDMLVFFSPYGIKSLQETFPGFQQGEKIIAVYGETTRTAADEAKLRIDIMAPNPTAPSMTMAIDQFLSLLNKKKK